MLELISHCATRIILGPELDIINPGATLPPGYSIVGSGRRARAESFPARRRLELVDDQNENRNEAHRSEVDARSVLTLPPEYQRYSIPARPLELPMLYIDVDSVHDIS